MEDTVDVSIDIMANTHVIVSTASGTGKASEVWETVVKPQLERKRYELHYTTSEHTISELTRDVFLPKANAGLIQYIVLLSGDGGVLDVVNTLLSSDRSVNYRRPFIAIIPLGTGNAMAESIGVSDVTAGIQSFLRGTPRELPLFRASFSPGARQLYNEAKEERKLHVTDGVPAAHGAVVCSWGLHAGLVADSDTAEYRKFGVERFKMAAKEALYPADGSLPHVYRAKVSVQAPEGSLGVLRNGEHAYVLATLVSRLEKGFDISPNSQPLDGVLRLVHFGPMSGDAAMEVMGKAYQGGKHVEDERVGYQEIERLRIDFEEDDARWRRICVDGKIIRVEKGGWVEVSLARGGVVDLLVQ